MVVTIDRDGCLVVKSETDLEAYALTKWAAENFCPGVKENIIIHTGKNREV